MFVSDKLCFLELGKTGCSYIREILSASGEKKSSSFDGKKKFKSRSDRPKSFTFKKHSQKRAKV